MIFLKPYLYASVLRFMKIKKYLIMGLLLSSTTICSAQNFITDEPEISILERIKNVSLQEFKFDLDNNYFRSNLTEDSYRNLKLLTPLQHNLTGYPRQDFTDSNKILFDSIVQNQIVIGNRKLTSTYVFDINGNMTDYQFSIPIGKSN